MIVCRAMPPAPAPAIGMVPQLGTARLLLPLLLMWLWQQAVAGLWHCCCPTISWVFFVTVAAIAC